MNAASTAVPSTDVPWLICATYRQDHAVTDDDMEAGLVAGTDQTICGHTVYTCSMHTPPGSPCPDCDDRHAQRVADGQRHNRSWRCLARRVRRG